MIIQRTIDINVANGDYPGLVNMILLLLGLLIVQAIIQYLHTYYSGWLGQNIIKDIRIRLYKHIQSLKLQFFDKTPIGRLVTRNVSDIETLAEVFSTGIAGIISDVLQILVILGVMFYMDWTLTLVSLALFPLLILATYVLQGENKSSVQ